MPQASSRALYSLHLLSTHFGMERVLTCGLAFGALCVLSIGFFNPPFWLLSIIIFGAGIAGGCQAGINSLSGLAYPTAIRSTGAGWALGAGRIGTARNRLAQSLSEYCAE